jgi:transcriptional regulator with XRE-family HTH domain
MGNKANPKLGLQPIPLHLKGWRKFRDLSQEQLAELIGTTKATISRIENRKQNWDQAFLQAASEALRCDPRDLMMRDPSQPHSLWSILDQLTAPERQQAERLIVAIKGTGTDG